MTNISLGEILRRKILLRADQELNYFLDEQEMCAVAEAEFIGCWHPPVMIPLEKGEYVPFT